MVGLGLAVVDQQPNREERDGQREADHNGQKLKVHLLYGNRDNTILFKAELDGFAQRNPELKVDYIIDSARIDEDRLKQAIQLADNPYLYLSGPEPMVEAFAVMVKKLGVSGDQIRTDLNSLAQVYKLDTLAYLPPPAPGRAGQTAAAVPGGVVGYIVDQSCTLKGKGMWTNATCIARCIRDGDKAVLVTEQGKIYQIANPDKIDSDAYGLKVTIVGKTDSDTITIASLTM